MLIRKKYCSMTKIVYGEGENNTKKKNECKIVFNNLNWKQDLKWICHREPKYYVVYK